MIDTRVILIAALGAIAAAIVLSRQSREIFNLGLLKSNVKQVWKSVCSHSDTLEYTGGCVQDHNHSMHRFHGVAA